MYRVGAAYTKDYMYDDVEKYFKNPTYEGTSNTNTFPAVMYDTVDNLSKKTTTATENGHTYEALDKEMANGTTTSAKNNKIRYRCSCLENN